MGTDDKEYAFGDVYNSIEEMERAMVSDRRERERLKEEFAKSIMGGYTPQEIIALLEEQENRVRDKEKRALSVIGRIKKLFGW